MLFFKILKGLFRALMILVILAVIGVGILSIAEYRPKEVETVIAPREAEARIETGKTLSLVSWNAGYGALGDNADFFMDGGKSVYSSSRERVETNLAGMRDTLKKLDPDLIILQEVDIHSDRSYGIDERETLREAMPGADEAFAYNYNALYVPYPLPPIGHVESGLFTLSKAPAKSAERISLPCPFAWPIRTVNLKRGLLVSRFPVRGEDRELVLINLHLEAYDNGEGKEAQTKQLASFIQDEYDKDNYVIAGGISTSASRTSTRARGRCTAGCGSPGRSPRRSSGAISPCGWITGWLRAAHWTGCWPGRTGRASSST